MRLDEPFVYEITNPGAVPALFSFMMDAGPIALKEAYATYNMGVGFAAYVAPDLVQATLDAARASGYTAWESGRVHKDGVRKAVEVPSLGLCFSGETLQVR